MNQQPSLVCVDDEEQIRKALRRELESWLNRQGWNFHACSGGEEALELLASNSNTAILLSDLKMPGMSGSTLVQMVADRYPEVVTMLLSGYSDVQEISHSIRAGISAFIQKPWDNSSLKAEIARAITLYNIKKQNREYRSYLEEEILWTKRIQNILLENSVDEDIPVLASLTYLPMDSTRCGGDMYWIRRLKNDKFLVALADVSAQGVKGTYFAARLKQIADRIHKNKPALLSSPDHYLSEINNQLYEKNLELPDLLVALQVLVFDINASTLHYANAGHLPFFHISEGEIHSEHLTSPGLGYKPGITYRERLIGLKPGDRIIMHTDGLLKDSNSGVAHNSQSLIKLIPDHKGEDWVNLFIDGVKNTREQRRFWDDVTVIDLQVE
ncbi:PP2C family protein-serine/threonine phosphatase [Salinispira pacifica]|uniref:Response regulator n=1 Tax=Salinispira pacifica TaxID=1307761 RepID=V5WJ02_9SPIO|nr:fused response regulator/phosphatase [Salinispira pacifica]AHC15509.1 Response regulator [Salinispira pacifica]